MKNFQPSHYTYHVMKKEKILFSQIVCSHPVLHEDYFIRNAYYKMLVSFLNLVQEIDYSSASLKLYRNQMKLNRLDFHHELKLPGYLSVLLLFDIIAISGYDKTLLVSQDYQKLLSHVFRFTNISRKIQTALRMLYQDFHSENPAWEIILQACRTKTIYNWIELLKKNISFAEKKPFSILITATMSAGKSTLINALSGKKIAKTISRLKMD